MRLTPRPLSGDDLKGFTNDIFGYKTFGERFANLVCNIDEPLVIALDGAWGSGKTTFIKQWMGLLRQRTPSVPVIYFDAFENDFHEDAFMVLAGEIVNYAKSQNNGVKGKVSKFTKRAAAVGKAMVPIVAKAGLRALTVGALSANDIENLSDSLKEGIVTVSDDIGLLLEKQIQDRINNAAREKEEISSFKNALEDLVAQLKPSKVSETDTSPPLVVIIDELDRCKPSFAINMLERVKHLFSVPGVCFVFVTYFPQIEASIRAQYGSTINSKLYLEKFFNLHVALPERNVNGSIQKEYINYLWKSLNLKSFNDLDIRSVMEVLLYFSEKKKLSLRTIEKIFATIILILSTNTLDHGINSVLIITICVMKHVDPQRYNMAREETLKWIDLKSFILEPSGIKVNRPDEDAVVSAWQPYFDESHGDDVNQCQSQRNIRDALKGPSGVSYIASYIEELPNKL